MSLNIKNEETHRLAAELASRTGVSISEAVSRAIKEQLNRLESPEARAERLLAIGRECAARLPKHVLEMDINAELYDESGLPR